MLCHPLAWATQLAWALLVQDKALPGTNFCWSLALPPTTRTVHPESVSSLESLRMSRVTLWGELPCGLWPGVHCFLRNHHVLNVSLHCRDEGWVLTTHSSSSLWWITTALFQLPEEEGSARIWLSRGLLMEVEQLTPWKCSSLLPHFYMMKTTSGSLILGALTQALTSL